jgi:hypothetical protein
MILALTLSAKTCNTLTADYSARLDALSLSLTRTSARACGTLTGDAAAFPKLINTLNRDINGAICRRAVRIAERLTLAADEIGQALPLDDEPTPSVCEVIAEAPAEVVEAPAPVSAEVVQANGAAAADAWVDVERAKRHYTQALRASVEGSSIVSAAARRFLDAARALDQLNDGVEAPAYPADEYIAEARLAVRQAPMTAHRLALALALDVQALFSSTVTPSAELVEAARAWCAAEVAAGVPLAGFLARVVGRIVDLSLPAELPAPVVVEAPRVTLRPRALTLRALRLAVTAKRGEGARVEPRPALRYAARAPFRALAYLAARHPAIYALLTDTASEARMSWRSCPRAAAEALRWEALAEGDARGCSYCPAGYTWRGVARAVARAEAAAAKAPRRRRAR